jgi:hypothetical protein
MPNTGVPHYASVLEACKVGCFCCGALLNPEDVKPQKCTTKMNARYVVVCSSCGDPTMFAVRSSKCL